MLEVAVDETGFVSSSFVTPMNRLWLLNCFVRRQAVTHTVVFGSFVLGTKSIHTVQTFKFDGSH